MKLGDLETICENCVCAPGNGSVPHDGPCSDECEEGLTGCHCVEPRPIPNPFAWAVIRVLPAPPTKDGGRP